MNNALKAKAKSNFEIRYLLNINNVGIGKKNQYYFLLKVVSMK